MAVGVAVHPGAVVGHGQGVAVVADQCLPLAVDWGTHLCELAEKGVIKGVAPMHFGFMGGGGNVEVFTNETGPSIAQKLKDENVDAVVMTAG